MNIEENKTFNKLKRQPFDSTWDAITIHVNNLPVATRYDNFEELLKSYGWTLEEFARESTKSP